MYMYLYTVCFSLYDSSSTRYRSSNEFLNNINKKERKKENKRRKWQAPAAAKTTTTKKGHWKMCSEAEKRTIPTTTTT